MESPQRKLIKKLEDKGFHVTTFRQYRRFLRSEVVYEWEVYAIKDGYENFVHLYSFDTVRELLECGFHIEEPTRKYTSFAVHKNWWIPGVRK